MTTEELYKTFEDKYFQDNTLGSIFSNVYIYPYDVKEENRILSTIADFKKRLSRPSNNLDILYVDLFQLMMDYLKSNHFGNRGTYLDFFQQKEKEGLEMSNSITQKIDTDNEEFLKMLNDKIATFLDQNNSKNDGLKRSIVILYGVTQIYPYLRVNQLLSNFEQYNTGEKYKLVLCYPGEATDSSFSLFGILKDNHAYRAQILS